MKKLIERILMDKKPTGEMIIQTQEEIRQKYDILPDFLKKKIDETCIDKPDGIVSEEEYLKWLEKKLSRIDALWMGMYAGVLLIVVALIGATALGVKLLIMLAEMVK